MFKRIFVIFTLLCVAQGCRRAELPKSLHTSLGEAPSFSLTDQNGETFSSDNLNGKIWVVNFFFSRCLGGCPEMMDNTAALHRQFAGNNNVAFVSITLDPQSDTPEVLTAYAEQKNADTKRWHFLTGDESFIHVLVEKKFKQSVKRQPNKDPGFAILHTFFMIVVDKNGEMVGYIGDGRKSGQVAALGDRIEKLRSNPSLLEELRYIPTLNASLNSTCGVLLLIGLIAVKKRRLTFHKVMMLCAFAVSMIFLASYLYYHFIFLRGQSIRFQGEGAVRIAYFSILISHTILAAAVAPLAIITVILGLRDNRVRHRRFARFTYPIWMYVSITGVVIYIMLYHLYPPPV